MSEHIGIRDSPTSGDPVRISVRDPAARRKRGTLVGVFLFLSLWFLYGVAINLRNLEAFNLQQAGVEAIVERHQFSLEGSASQKLQIRVYFDGDKPFGDTFLYNNRQYAAKQPGQFMAGAVVYFFLHFLGLSYVSNYQLTSALVTFFTTSVITAASAVVVFALAKKFLPSRSPLWWALAVALTYGLGTTAFAYSGVAYHDLIATGYVVTALYLLVLLSGDRFIRLRARLAAAAAGALLGLTITTSMLPFFIVLVVGLYLISLRKWSLLLPALAGGAVGIAPLLFYNAVSFGNPFLLANVAGRYEDTFFRLNAGNLLQKARFYASAVTLYVPVFWIGLLGLIWYPRDLRRQRFLIVSLLVLQAIYVLNIGSAGGCQYGPRYLLPAMPFACLGLIGIAYVPGQALRRLLLSAAILAGAISFLVNLAGVLYGTMYCDSPQFAFWSYAAAIRRGELSGMPLAQWLAIPLVASAVFLIWSFSIRLKSEQRP